VIFRVKFRRLEEKFNAMQCFQICPGTVIGGTDITNPGSEFDKLTILHTQYSWTNFAVYTDPAGLFQQVSIS